MTSQIQIAKNVIWIVVDSVRNYHTDTDDRGRIAVMDELAQNAIEFKTAVTSAPSTVMSISAMMTGVPAIFHSTTYNDFDFDVTRFKSLATILEQQGYNPYSIIFFPEGREFLAPVFGNICRDCWPKHANPNELWDNDLINKILRNLLAKGIKQPFFLCVNYNCRHDPQTSDKVKHGIKMLKDQDLTKDAVLVVNSDHGYPDPSRKITFYQRRKFGHDLVMTNDNILVPLVISYPGCSHQTIEQPVSLLDVMPTILELIGKAHLCDFSHLLFHGKSLVPLIANCRQHPCQNVRIDNRYIFQDRRIVALYDGNHKYIYSFDEQIEEFYDLRKDPDELNNLASDGACVNTTRSFRDELFRQEEVIYAFHKEILKDRLSRIIQQHDQSIALLGRFHKNFVKVVTGILAELGVRKLILFEQEHTQKTLLARAVKEKNMKLEFVGENVLPLQNIDLALAILVDKNPRVHYRMRKLASRLKPRRTVYANYNLKLLPTPPFWLGPAIKAFVHIMTPRIKESSKTFLTDLPIVIRKFLSG